MAVACAIAVSALYISQPILPMIGEAFNADLAETGMIPTLTQAGYALGLFLLVPLADRINPKQLISMIVVANILSFAGCAIAPSLHIEYLTSGLVGVTAVSAQIMIPVLSGLAPSGQRGRVLGALLGGMAGGLLTARVASGIVAEIYGWRSVFAMSILADVVLLIIISRFMPTTSPSTRLRWLDLMVSMAGLVAKSAVLRSSSMIGFTTFAAFSAIWSTLSPLLAQEPYSFGPATAGAFGLVGAVNVLLSSAIGIMTDRLGARIVVFVGSSLTMLSFMLLGAAPFYIIGLISSLLLLDLGNRINLVANQTRVYADLAYARSRANCVFMTSYFLGGATGGYLGSLAAKSFGFHGVALVGIGFSALSILFHLAFRALPQGEVR
ncbi:hypothetical protein ASC96_18680 [Rhizobium sp. Root1204]|nr:hypothetical protein ASC96_18680 [Rhizobium sp. Root1204]